MRDFFINSLQKIVAVLIIVMAVAVLAGGLGVMFAGPAQGGGFLPGLMVLIFGAVYVLVVGGFLYLALGVYDNTKRTAEAVEAMAAKG